MRIWIVGVCLAVLIFGCTGNRTDNAETEAPDAATQAVDAAAVRHDVLYTCDCGPECDCKTVRLAAGNCECGKPLVWGHVVKIEDTEALLCRCAENCECAVNAEDPSLCGCGNPLKRVNLAGTGLYFCNCGGSCECNYVSDAPGKCKCGMDLVQG
jgi:hypothetical protein